VLFIFVTMLLHFFENLSLAEDDDFDSNYDFMNYRATGSFEASLAPVTFEVFILFADLMDDDFDIFYDCLSSFEDSGALSSLYITSHIYLLSSVLFTVYFPAFIITSLILLITTVGIFFILFQVH